MDGIEGWMEFWYRLIKFLVIKKTNSYMKTYLLLFFSILYLNAFSQSKGTVYAVTSEKGNVIRYWPNVQNPEELTAVMASTRKFIIRRSEMGTGDLKYSEIGAVNFPRTAADFTSRVATEDYAELKRLLSLTSDSEIDTYLATKFDVEKFSLFMEIKHEFLLAFGLGFLDQNVKKGEFFEYEVIREDTNGNQETWGNTALFAKEGNVELERVKIALDTTMAGDSAVNFRWKVGIPDFTAIDFQKLADSSGTDMKRLKTYRGNSGYREALTIFNRYSLNSVNTSFSVYYRVNDEKEWRFHEKQIPGSDSAKTGNFVNSTIYCNPEDYVEAVIVPQDFMNNKGSRSEVASAYAITVNSVKLIYGVNARDSVNAIVLNWEELPNKPYYSGISISKSSGQKEKQLVEILPPGADQFVDTKIFPVGTQFSYYVEPVFAQVNHIQQLKPATVIHSCTTFSKPSVPYGLKMVADGNLAKLSWEADEDAAFYSYHVLRGTHPKKLSLISGHVHEKEFSDTIAHMSSRLTYYYAVMSMNVMQDTSHHSPVISFVPSKKEVVKSPPMVSFQVINKKIYLSWDDVKRNDVEIAGYVLQKDEGAGFSTLHSGVLEANIFIDEKFDPSTDSHYSVASVSIKGDTSHFSPSTTLRQLNTPSGINPVTDIVLTNLKNSVRVAWPGILAGSISKFKIYRRVPDEAEFKFLNKVSTGTFEFEDKDVKKGQIYVYTVTAVNDQNKESEFSEEQTIFKE